jgi:hypothetical protein
LDAGCCRSSKTSTDAVKPQEESCDEGAACCDRGRAHGQGHKTYEPRHKTQVLPAAAPGGWAGAHIPRSLLPARVAAPRMSPPALPSHCH